MRLPTLIIISLLTFAAGPATRPIDKFVRPTDEQNAKAIAQAKKVGADVQKSLTLKLEEFESAHFIIYTDWDKREHQFLKDACEASYTAVSKQFDIPSKENVFVGKLALYMFAKKEDFRKYAHTYDEYPAGDDLLGYYSVHADGSGHLAMYKPEADPQNQVSPKQQWAYVMTRELAKAFVDRYRSDAIMPVWLHEGIAESVAQSLFPSATIRYQAKVIANTDSDLDFIFKAEARPTKALDPAVWSMTQMLISRDRKKFIQYIDAIKDGEDPQNALQGIYGFDFAGFVKAWKVYALSK